MICIGRHVGGHTLALQHGGQNGACNLQVAGQNLKYARTVNAKVILRKGSKDNVALLMKESFFKLFSNFLTEELSLCLQMPFHLICR